MLQDGDAVGKNALLLPGEGGQALGHSAEPLPPRGTAARQHGPDPNLPAIMRGIEETWPGIAVCTDAEMPVAAHP